jgi:regulator of sirC expression with transglutaminase-like and TPR domain
MARRVLLLVALLTLFFASTVFAQLSGLPSSRGFSDSTEITVNVSDATNKAAGDVRVEIVTLSTRAAIATGYTLPDGTVTLPNIPNGNYEVIVTRGITSATERVEVLNSPAAVHIRLPGSPDVIGQKGKTVSVAQYKVPAKARKAFNKAEEAFAERNLERANKEVANALQLHPQFAEALTLRGILKLDADDNNGAIDDLSAAINVDPSYATAYLALGAAFNRAQRFDEALQTLDRGVALDPASWQGYFEIGKAHVSKGDYLAGIKGLEKAQSMSNDRYPPLHLVKAHALLALRQYENAMLELQAFVEKSPEAPQSAVAREMMEKTKAFISSK